MHGDMVGRVLANEKMKDEGYGEDRRASDTARE